MRMHLEIPELGNRTVLRPVNGDDEDEDDDEEEEEDENEDRNDEEEGEPLWR